MPKPKVKFGELDEYFWKEIAPREARKNRKKVGTKPSPSESFGHAIREN